MEKDKKEKSLLVKVKKRNSKRNGERISVKRIKACGLSNLYCSHSISNHQVLPWRAKAAFELKKKVELKIAVQQN